MGHCQGRSRRCHAAPLFRSRDPAAESGSQLPSSEKLFAPMNFFRMNSSKITASVRRVRIRNCSSRLRVTRFWTDFHSLLQPIADRGIVDVHELDADRPAVGGPQTRQNLAKGQDAFAAHRPAREFPIHVRSIESVVLGRKFRQMGFRSAERIHVRGPVSAYPVISDKLVDPLLEGRCSSAVRERSSAAGVSSVEQRRWAERWR